MASGARIRVVFLTLSIYTGLIFSSKLNTSLETSICYSTPIMQDLMSALIPKYYNILLKIEETSFQAEANISFELLRKSEIISFHVRNLDVDFKSIMISQNTSESEQPDNIHYCNETSTIMFVFEDIVCPGYHNISMRYSGSLYKNKEFLRIKEEKEKGNITWSYMIIFEEDSGEYIFPYCKKEVVSKAIFKISVEYLDIYQIFSNIPQDRFEWIEQNTIQMIFKPTSVIPTYPSTIAIIKLDELSESPYNLWFGQEGINKTDSEVKIITYVADEFLTQYTQTRLETSIIVTFSDFPKSTLGTWPFVLLSKSDLVYDKKVQFPGRTLEIWKTIAYRKAEQYIQSIVNLDNWSYMWFSKALALYLSYNILGQSFNSKKMMELFVVQVQLPAMHNDITLNVPSITDPYDPIYSIFVYKKASVLLRMLEHIVTKEIFQKAVAEYLHIYARRTSSPIHFFNILNQLNEPEAILTYVMSIWLSRKYYPIITVVQHAYNNTYYVYNDFQDSIKWPIPITYITKKTDQTSRYTIVHWLNNNYTKWNPFLELTLDSAEDWIILNVQYSGYYRVRYDNINWLKIAHFLKEDNGKTIPVLNRVQLIDDAYHFVMMDMMDYKFYYELIDFLRNETEFIVWHSMMNVLHYMSPFFKFPESESFKNFIMDIMNSVLMQIGYDEKVMDDNALKAMRLMLLNWMCNHGNDKCRQSASDKLRAYFKDAKESPILPGWQNWVYCAGLMKPDRELRMLAKNKILHEIDENMVQYLSCYDDDDSIQELLIWIKSNPPDNMSLLDDVQKGDLYRTIVKKHARKFKVLDFILDNILHLMPDNTSFFEISHIIMSVHSECQLRKIEQYIDDNVHSDEMLQNAKHILPRRISQISKEKYMFVHHFPYDAGLQETEC
ncbi:aminopeptidase N-like [Harpegnathos saltator]|uniref:aminopeptidase N-like n=1 Tax=Harpegnathos saltator TaxID=610380 RepID=UPI000DBEE793|nr:aminopeptidase N-like [Harpegnathos saltator]